MILSFASISLSHPTIPILRIVMVEFWRLLLSRGMTRPSNSWWMHAMRQGFCRYVTSLRIFGYEWWGWGRLRCQKEGREGSILLLLISIYIYIVIWCRLWCMFFFFGGWDHWFWEHPHECKHHDRKNSGKSDFNLQRLCTIPVALRGKGCFILPSQAGGHGGEAPGCWCWV